MSLIFKKEKFEDIMGELPELFYAHWKENEEDQDKIPLKIDWVKLLKLEALGVLHILTARTETKLVGYFIIYIQPTTHHASVLLAASDAFYIAPKYRKGITGAHFIKEAIKMARDLGAKKLYISVKAGSPAAKLLSLMGLTLSEEAYSCLL